jgi:hypothetical protein
LPRQIVGLPGKRYTGKDVQLSFMKYTTQLIIKDVGNTHKEVSEKDKKKEINK